MNELYFQYCQKLMVFSEKLDKVLLAKRKGEQDYDGIFSFIGGKLETSDGGLLEGMRREKNEEIGKDAEVLVSDVSVFNAYFVKKDGSSMILPHYICKYQGGDIKLNDEYSEYKWVNVDEIADFEPKIETIQPAIERAKQFFECFSEDDFVKI